MTDDIPVTEWSESADIGQFTVTRHYPGGGDMTAVEFVLNIQQLVARSNKLVELLNESEHQHGGLLTTNMLNAKNQLALELSRWK